MKYVYLTLIAAILGGCTQPGAMRPADYMIDEFPERAIDLDELPLRVGGFQFGTRDFCYSGTYGERPGYCTSNGATVWEGPDAE